MTPQWGHKDYLAEGSMTKTHSTRVSPSWNYQLGQKGLKESLTVLYLGTLQLKQLWKSDSISIKWLQGHLGTVQIFQQT